MLDTNIKICASNFFHAAGDRPASSKVRAGGGKEKRFHERLSEVGHLQLVYLGGTPLVLPVRSTSSLFGQLVKHPMH